MIFDRARFIEDVPVVAAHERPGGGEEEKVDAGERLFADELAETDVVANGERARDVVQEETDSLRAAAEMFLLADGREGVHFVISRDERAAPVENVGAIEKLAAFADGHRARDDIHAVFLRDLAAKGNRLAPAIVGSGDKRFVRMGQEARIPNLRQDENIRRGCIFGGA